MRTEVILHSNQKANQSYPLLPKVARNYPKLPEVVVHRTGQNQVRPNRIFNKPVKIRFGQNRTPAEPAKMRFGQIRIFDKFFQRSLIMQSRKTFSKEYSAQYHINLNVTFFLTGSSTQRS